MDDVQSMNELEGGEALARDALEAWDCEVWWVSVLVDELVELVQILPQELCHNK